MVLDASAAVTWLFEDERDELALAMAESVADRGAVVPALFRWEVQNALLNAERRKRITTKQLDIYVDALGKLELHVDAVSQEAAFSLGIALARRYELTAYDAAYLELALRRGLLLMTRDDRLAKAAAEVGSLWKG